MKCILTNIYYYFTVFPNSIILETAGLPNALFATGAVRSGTTLLEKMLCSHPQLSVLAQPFQLLFSEIKKSFHKQIGHEEMYYVLSHYCGERKYAPEDLDKFLADFEIPRSRAIQMMEEILAKGYSGQLTEIDPAKLSRLSPKNSFASLYSELVDIYRHREDSKWNGCKEVMCEEFVPYFLGEGIPCFIIIRDPRDMISSIYYGKGDEYVGSPLPLLYALHNWRKSVQFAIAGSRHDNFCHLRYEDLVNAGVDSLNRIAGILGIEPFSLDLFKEGILDQQGEVWKSNSSFDSQTLVSRDSVGRYKSRLSPDLVNHINSVCYRELTWLGYDVELPENPEQVIRDFSEPVSIERDGIMLDYSTNPDRQDFEIKRISRFSREHCILEAAYEELAKVPMPS